MDVLRRPTAPEDAVFYRLFQVRESPSKKQVGEQSLEAVVQEILAEVAPLLIQYIWQNQPFNLKHYPEKGGIPAHVGGSTQFGDNVEDEWFIVYLLQQITRAFPMLAASVEDSDGQFLLIEAADHLPKWLNPESSENRVFLFRGELHILPVPARAGDVGCPRDVTPSLTQALDLLSTHKQACLANHRIRSRIEKRLEGYPGRIHASLHRAHCFVPAGIAAVLAHRPDLLAPAVSAFYLRDPLDLQACRAFQNFPPETRVLTRVTFSRCLYAQLLQQPFTPDRRSGFTLPAPSHPQYRAHELGMKLAHGFEILCSKCPEPWTQSDVPVTRSPLWKGFLSSLKRNDYFRGEMDGSSRYRELMAAAENFFRQSVSPPESVRSPGQEVLQVLQGCPFSVKELRKLESDLPPEDSDSWLDISPQDLERLLEETAGQGAQSSNRHQSKETGTANQEESGYSLVAVTQGMKKFINTVSSHEGAELPWSHSTEPFTFDPDSMATALDRLLGRPDQELDSDDLEDDDDDDDDDEGVAEGGGPGHDGEEGAEAVGNLRKYMDQMDRELRDTNIGQSFAQKGDGTAGAGEGAQRPGTEEEPVRPLDLDLNLLTNMLESLSSQEGLAGPASNLLQSLGIRLPPNADR